MPPNSMLPPSTYAHRRTKVNACIELPLSPPYSPESPACLSPKMRLLKGATFHVPSSPPAEDDPFMSIPHLPQRSPTSSHSLLNLMLNKETDAATKSITEFEQCFSHSAKRQPTNAANALDTYKSQSIPVDEKAQQRRLSAQFSDSGLGSSIASNSVKDFNGIQEKVHAEGISTELDHRQCEDLLELDTKNPTSCLLAHQSRSAVARSIAPIKSSSPKPLSNSARRKINDCIFQPLLREERFKFFHPLVKSLGHRSKNSVKCLRDLERSLIFEPLVSAIHGGEMKIGAHSISSKKLPVSKLLYRSFGEFSVQLVLDTYLHLSEPEQRRAVDRPYDNGYFLDLVQQVGRLAAQVSSSRQAASNEDVPTDEMAYSPDDVVTLEGGLSQTGDFAELVRWNKDGKGVSLRTNKTYEAYPGLKRQADGEFDEDAERAMARRKKNADPTPLQLKCCDSSCNKIFDRKCDLAKHEKTHTRPFKCPFKTCSYNDKGLPTEKERERHINDKHTKHPKLYNCKFCEFSTKRESNCKQHMEKKHGFVYERTKGKGKKLANTPQTPNLDTPSTETVDYSTSAGSTAGSVFPTPVEQPLNDFRMTPSTPFHDSMNDFSPVDSGAFDPTNEHYGNHFDFSAPLFDQSSVKNEATFSSPSTGFSGIMSNMPNNVEYPFSASDFTVSTNSTVGDGALRLNTQHHMSNAHYDRSFIGGLLTPSTSLQNLQPYSSNPSISGPSPVGPAASHTFSPSMESMGSVHNQATITPTSNHNFVHPNFSPVGQDHLLTEYAGDSQLNQMTALPSSTLAENFDTTIGPSSGIPDFDLYGDGTCHMELDYGPGNADDVTSLFGM